MAQTSDRIASMHATFAMKIYYIDPLAINITMHTSVNIQLYIMLLCYLDFNNNVQTMYVPIMLAEVKNAPIVLQEHLNAKRK